MSPVPRAPMVVTALAVLLQAGCAPWVTRPALPRVEFTLKATRPTGTPLSPPVLESSIRNVGDATVWHGVGCGCESRSTVLGPDGDPVYLYDPSTPPPLCPCGRAPLEPGEELGGPFVFTGTLYEAGHAWPSPTYMAPAGVYTVIARYHYATSYESTHWILLERRATLTWVP